MEGWGNTLTSSGPQRGASFRGTEAFQRGKVKEAVRTEFPFLKDTCQRDRGFVSPRLGHGAGGDAFAHGLSGVSGERGTLEKTVYRLLPTRGTTWEGSFWGEPVLSSCSAQGTPLPLLQGRFSFFPRVWPRVGERRTSPPLSTQLWMSWLTA